MGFFKEQWYVLPAISGVLLVLSFPPFPFWPLGAVALVPLFYTIAAYPRTAREVFWSGGIAGGMLVFALYYLTLFQFQWLPGSEVLVQLVRVGILPTTLIAGVALGGALFMYHALRSRHLVLNSLVGGAAYFLFEYLFNLIFQGYYTGTLAYLFTPVPVVAHFAALGGAELVSLLVAVVACLIAEFGVAHRQVTKRGAIGVILFVGVLVGIGMFNEWHFSQPTQPLGRVSVAVLQPGTRENFVFGTTTARDFVFPQFTQLYDASSFGSYDFVVYPLSFVDGTMYRVGALGGWERDTFPASTTVVTWDSVHEGSNLYSTFQFWEGGEVVEQHHKQALHILDSIPAWLSHLGEYEPLFRYHAGSASAARTLQGVSVGSLVCSELVLDKVAAEQARDADLLLSIGSEAMFMDNTLGLFSVRAAQYRAIEYNVPVVRADMLGPSALISNTGELFAHASWGTKATLAGEIALSEPRPTLYSRLGHAPLSLLLSGTVLVAIYVRWRTISLRTRG